MAKCNPACTIQNHVLVAYIIAFSNKKKTRREEYIERGWQPRLLHLWRPIQWWKRLIMESVWLSSHGIRLVVGDSVGGKLCIIPGIAHLVIIWKMGFICHVGGEINLLYIGYNNHKLLDLRPRCMYL
jgi:hypothetical protein